MLITFRSEGLGDVMMFGDAAMRLLEIMGKEPGGKGIITIEQLPAVIARLERAVAGDRAQRQAGASANVQTDDAGDEPDGEAENVDLARRAWPLLGLLEQALKEEHPVVWGS